MNYEKPSLSEDEIPEYKLGFSEKGTTEILEVLNPAQMRFEYFRREYLNTMENVKEKEKDGRLDPYDKSYIPMNKNEWDLMAKDWKEFSRSRGFSEEDIEEYEKWLVLSGQKDELVYAVNDPWRKGVSVDNFIKDIYSKHIEKAIEKGYAIPGDVIFDYNEIIKKENNDTNFLKSQDEMSPENSTSTVNKDEDWD